MFNKEVDYEDVLNRIAGVYNSCNMIEQKLMKQILLEVQDKGYSQTLEQIWLIDFKEVPVSIDEFISNPLYMGPATRNGDAVYPFWRHTMNEIYLAGNKHNEIIFSGATRIGKTSTAVAMLAYMLYKLMLYRNPHEYFGIKEISRFTIAFANLTKDLAAGVAYREFFDTLKVCEWFQDHGKFSRSERNFVYYPEGDQIEIIPASDSAHVLGMQLWACLIGDTQILTSNGIFKLSELTGKFVHVLQISYTGELNYSYAQIKCTKYVNKTIRIYFSNDYYVEGTEDHRIKVNGSYKMLQDICIDDNIEYIDFKDVRVISLVKPVKIECIEYKVAIPVYDVINAKPNHNFLIKCGNFNVVSHNCFMDEVNFTKAGVKDINIAKRHMKQLYDAANARITGTFKVQGEVYGKLFVCSSKNSDSDFLSDHIKNQLDAGNVNMYLVDEPQWNVLPSWKFNKETFHITVGDRYNRGFVIPLENDDESHRREYEEQGYQILEVPIDYLSNFRADYDIALRDIAGISVIGAMGFITQESITPCIAQDRVNPFYNDVIVMGMNDNETLERNFHIDEVDNHLKHCSINIHIDFAEVSDRIGICGVAQDGTKIVRDAVTEKKIVLPFYRQVFQIGIEAPQGDRMSFQKVINFIIWLRRNGFYINLVSTDQYQSSYVRETLNQQGFTTEKISVDSSLDPYIGLRNLLQDQRIELIKHQLQEDELVNLQRVNGRIDHPPQTTYSDGTKSVGKDTADALCGAAWAHIQSKDVVKPSGKSIAKSVKAVNGFAANRKRVQRNTSQPSIFNSSYIKRK